MRRLLAFSGLRCVTFCLMDNHFHLLLEVGDEEGQAFKAGATAEEVFERVGALYEAEEVRVVRETYGRLLASSRSGRAAREYLQTFLDRMYNLSTFMKELKARFTMWYNRRKGRKGTLWEERFKSVLCEGKGEFLKILAAYIDLNPVRAGIVGDPKEYRWSGYGEAVAGDRGSRLGLVVAVSPEVGRGAPWRTVQAAYRRLLYGVGCGGRRGLSGAAVEAVIASGGMLSAAQVVRCRVRYFSYGMVLGSKAFIEEFFGGRRDLSGVRRKPGARRMRFGDFREMMVARDLRSDVLFWGRA
jgi:REP element-mobilizing transposase RayT